VTPAQAYQGEHVQLRQGTLPPWSVRVEPTRPHICIPDFRDPQLAGYGRCVFCNAGEGPGRPLEPPAGFVGAFHLHVGAGQGETCAWCGLPPVEWEAHDAELRAIFGPPASTLPRSC
jgi:hypothetical protein